MPRIEGNDGDSVQVTIIDGWFEKVGADQKLVIKLTGKSENNQTGIATLWMTGQRRGDDPKSDVEKNLELLEHLGLEDGNMLNFVEWVESRPTVTFVVSVKEKDGKTQVNYYVRSPIEKVDVATAAEMIEAIRGRAAAESASLAGEPINGDDNLQF